MTDETKKLLSLLHKKLILCDECRGTLVESEKRCMDCQNLYNEWKDILEEVEEIKKAAV